MKKALIASTSTVFDGTFLDYLLPVLKEHFATVSSLVFIPFARPCGISHEAYTEKIKPSLAIIDSFSCLMDDTEDGINLEITDNGITCKLSKNLPKYINQNK